MKQRITGLMMMMMILAVILSSCAPSPAAEPTPKPTNPPPTAEPTAEPTPEPTEEPVLITAVDSMDVEITLAEPAQRIITISPSTTEILFAIGAGNQVIGRDSNSLFPEEALAVQDLGAMWEGVPVEDILALEPDLVVTGENISEDSVKQMRDLGLVVFRQANPRDFPGLYDNLRDLALLTGKGEQGEELISSLQDRVAAVEGVLADVDEKPLVFYELDATDPTNPWTTGSGTFISNVISAAGGKNLGDVVDGEWVQISSEELVAQNPEIILLADALFGITVESVGQRAGWSNISAVLEGRIYPFDPNLLSVPGPRLVDGLEEAARLFHPALFE